MSAFGSGSAFAFGVAVSAESGLACPPGLRGLLVAAVGELLGHGAGVGLPGQPCSVGSGGEGTGRGGGLGCRSLGGVGLTGAVQGSAVGVDVVVHGGEGGQELFVAVIEGPGLFYGRVFRVGPDLGVAGAAFGGQVKGAAQGQLLGWCIVARCGIRRN